LLEMQVCILTPPSTCVEYRPMPSWVEKKGKMRKKMEDISKFTGKWNRKRKENKCKIEKIQVQRVHDQISRGVNISLLNGGGGNMVKALVKVYEDTVYVKNILVY
jgi:hypothetical protein